MLQKFSRLALMILAVVVMSVYLPRLYHMVLDEKTGKTQLFFSPVIKKFIYREMVGEGHQFVTRDEDGNDYERQTFETMIPFIYYKNMELWGKLPLIIDGKTFDQKTIKKNRQVFELKPRMIADRSPRIQVFPLLESVPGRARLRFPEDAFRFTDRMEFISVDTNAVDEGLTVRFTRALKEAGFVFPARMVSGRVSILKPFDEGFFIVDAAYAVFHIKRVNGQPVVVKTPIPRDLRIRNIKVSENKKREIYGSLLTEKGELFLIACDNYKLIRLPVDNYNPDIMDFKLIINPLYRTAIYSDDHTIYAVAMDHDYQPVSRYQRVMFAGQRTMKDIIFKAVFPFYIKTADKSSGYLRFDMILNGWLSMSGIAFALLITIIYMRISKLSYKEHWLDPVFILFTGLFGVVAVILIKPEASRGQRTEV